MTMTMSIREATTTIQQSALQWQLRRGWQATKRAVAARAMVTTKREAGKPTAPGGTTTVTGGMTTAGNMTTAGGTMTAMKGTVTARR